MKERLHVLEQIGLDKILRDRQRVKINGSQAPRESVAPTTSFKGIMKEFLASNLQSSIKRALRQPKGTYQESAAVEI